MSSDSVPEVGKSRLLRKLLIVGAACVVLVVVLYFVVTSGAFVRAVVLPRAGQALGVKLSAGAVAFSPFSQVQLRQVKVLGAGIEPLLEVEQATARYSLWDILGGRVAVSEVTMNSPRVLIVQNPDGTSNLDPLLKSLERMRSTKPAKRSAKRGTSQLDLKELRLNNASVRVLQNLKGGGRQSVELSALNLGADRIGNSQSGKLNVGFDLKVERALLPVPASNDVLQANFSAAFDVTLDAELRPQLVRSSAARLTVGQALGAFKDLVGLVGRLDSEITTTEIKQLALHFEQAGKTLGHVRASGPFDASKLEGKLVFEVAGIDRHVLNLAGAAFGLDFGSTLLNATNQITLAKGGQQIAITGQLAATSFSLTQRGLVHRRRTSRSNMISCSTRPPKRPWCRSSVSPGSRIGARWSAER